MPIYRKKPVEIEAIQYLGVSNLEEVLAFTGKHPNWDKYFTSMDDYKEFVATHAEIFKIKTLEGSMLAKPGDWIIRGVNGEHYPCKPDIFEKTYELVKD